MNYLEVSCQEGYLDWTHFLDFDHRGHVGIHFLNNQSRLVWHPLSSTSDSAAIIVLVSHLLQNYPSYTLHYLRTM